MEGVLKNLISGPKLTNEIAANGSSVPQFSRLATSEALGSDVVANPQP
jgi:hypothetical protein